MLVVEYSGLLVVEQHILIFFISKGKRACFESQYHVSAVVKYRYTYILSRSETSVVTVSKFLLAVGFVRFFLEKPRFRIRFFNESVGNVMSTVARFYILNSNS